jgi:hypothetical protein
VYNSVTPYLKVPAAKQGMKFENPFRNIPSGEQELVFTNPWHSDTALLSHIHANPYK